MNQKQFGRGIYDEDTRTVADLEHGYRDGPFAPNLQVYVHEVAERLLEIAIEEEQ